MKNELIKDIDDFMKSYIHEPPRDGEEDPYTEMYDLLMRAREILAKQS